MYKRTLVVSFAAFYLLGCANMVQGYSGPKQPREKLAVLHCVSPMQPHIIDDITITNGAHGSHIEVLPGEHKITAGIHRNMADGTVWRGTPRSVTFTVAAGEEVYCVADIDQEAKNWSLDTMPADEVMAAVGRGIGFRQVRRERASNGECYDATTGKSGPGACPELPAFEETDALAKKR